MIKINGLSKRYPNRPVFENVSCTFGDGRIHALVGVNGIGKTTLLTSIAQPASMDGGKVEIDGIDATRREARLRFFYVPDDKGMFLNLTGREYLGLVSRLYGQDAWATATAIEGLSASFKLEGSLDEYIAGYSLGMKQKVYLMASLLSGAGNLILDEPFNGLDPEGAAMLKSLLAAHRDAGGLVLFSVHNLDLVANFSDEVTFIDRRRRVVPMENPKDYARLERAFFENCA